MIIFDGNIEQFAKGAQRLFESFTRFQARLTGVGLTEKVWPKVRERIVKHLRENLYLINRVDVTSEGWRELKREAMSTPVSEYPELFKRRQFGQFTTIRYIGGNWLPIIDDDHWKATGTMERHLEEELDKGVVSIVTTQDALSAEIEVDVSILEDAYPITVDEKLMIASEGKIGLIRLLEWQEREVYEMLIRETGDLSAELMRGD